MPSITKEKQENKKKTQVSPIDELFESIWGVKPSKEGEAYERLAAAACKLIEKGGTVVHDVRLRGMFSRTLYQIDVLREQDGKKQFGETKDYTVKDEKVGRGDLQKLGGALLDLSVDGGQFFSATDYTGPAKLYAAASEKMSGKSIELFHLRPTTERDLEGRIRVIHFNIHILTPDYDRARFQPIWTDDGHRKAVELVKAGGIQDGDAITLHELYDSQGKTLTTVRDLTRTSLGGPFEGKAIACFIVPDAHLKISNTLIPIRGIAYNIPYTETIETIEIKSDGKATLLLKDEHGKVDKILTDVDLRKIQFTETGEAILADHRARAVSSTGAPENATAKAS